MLYPVLHIAPDGRLYIDIIDPYFDPIEGILTLGLDPTDEDAPCTWFTLLNIMLEQYAAGYDDGLAENM